VSGKLKNRFERTLLVHGLRSLSASWRLREQIPPDCIDAVEGREPVVIAFWHGSMLPVWHRFRHLDAVPVISASRDGELLSSYLDRIGYRTIIRGSSSRGGSEALSHAVSALSARSVLITPDGPRGPAGEAKPGALVAAARSNRRVLLVGCSARHAFRTDSWDRMKIPYPFTTIVLRYCILTAPTPNRIVSNSEIEKFGAALSRLEDTP
jgi:lysophospholipid acyltransferase (LPLAT)-like uncharacterized protein